MKANTLLENFEILAEAPGGIDRLREVILGLAVNGRLFSDTDLTKWQTNVTLKDFGGMIRGITYAKAESSKEPTPNFVPLLGAANIQRSINYEGLTFVASSLIKPSQYLKDGDILICMSSGSKHLVGKTGFVRNPPASSFGAFCGVFRISDENNRDYLAMFFKSPIYRTAISVASRGIGINNLRVGDIESIEVSLPPIAEQKRIVAKVDELMALCDKLEQQQKLRDNLRTATRKSAIEAISTATTPEELEAAWKRINNNWAVIADTPKSVAAIRTLILNLGVRGQLTSTLGNAKRREESFLELGSVLTLEYGKPLDKSLRTGKGNIPVYGANGVKAMTTQALVKESGIVVGRKGSAGEVNMTEGPFWPLDVTFFAKFDHKRFDLRYLHYLLKSLNLPQMARGIKPGINRNDVNKLKVLSVDLEEQKWIVSKVDELMLLCDQLESVLISRSQLAEKFARSVVNVS